MNRYIAVPLLTLTLLFTAGCFQKNSETPTESQAWALIEQGALILDVRTPEEYAQGHLDNALLIPHSQITSRIDELGSNKDQQIVVYCAVGGRAAKAEKILRDHGFSNILNAGGYDDMMENK